MDINLEILSTWGKLTNWNVLRDTKTFSISFTVAGEKLNVTNYDIKKINDKIEDIIKVDESGTLAVIYLRDFFYNTYVDSVKYTLKKLIYGEDADRLKDFKKLHDLFNLSIEESLQFIKKLSLLSMSSSDVKLLGNDIDYNKVYSYISDVLGKYKTLNKDVHSCGSKISSNLSIISSIKIVQSYAQALLEVENSDDGIYSYYIENKLMNGYFAIIVKSNNNILSVNDRVNETFPGQTSNSRTGRYADNKAFEIFPYDEVLTFKGEGYKGKESVFSVNDDKMMSTDSGRFFNMNSLSEEARIKFFMTIWFTILQYGDKSLDSSKKVFVDSLLKQSIQPLLEDKKQYALTIREDSTLLSSHDNVITIEDEDADYFKSFENIIKFKLIYFNNHSTETDYAHTKHSLDYVINQYAKDWQPDKTNIINQNRLLLTLQKNETAIDTNMEFVSSKEMFDKYYFWRVRQQLKEYAEENIQKEIKKYNGVDNAMTRFYSSIKDRQKLIINDIKSTLKNVLKDKEDTTLESLRGVRVDNKLFIASERLYGSPFQRTASSPLYLNNDTCPISGSRVENSSSYINVYYAIRDAEQMREVLDIDIKKEPLYNFLFLTTPYVGNHLLDMVDPLATYIVYNNPLRNYEYPLCVIRFSKRGLNKLLKEVLTDLKK